jgi:hypothetical protein
MKFSEFIRIVENKYLDKLDDADSIREALKLLFNNLINYSQTTRKKNKTQKLEEFCSVIGFKIKPKFIDDSGEYDFENMKKSFSRFINSSNKSEYYLRGIFKKLRAKDFFNKNNEWN